MIVSAAGISPNHSDGQWFSLWNNWSGWAFAIERLVDGFGNSSRVHRTWTSGTEWGARTNASDLESGDNPTDFESPASSTTTDGPLGKDLQPNSTSSRVGAADTRTSLSSEAFAATPCAVELRQWLGSALREKQRADQVARAKAVRGRSIYRLPGWDQNGQRGKMHDLFRGAFDRGIVGIGCGWNASSQISTTELIFLRWACFGEKNQSRKRSRASRWNPLRSGSLRSPPRSRFQRDAIRGSLIDQRKNESCVADVYAHCVTHVCARCPPQPSPRPTGRGRRIRTRAGRSPNGDSTNGGLRFTLSLSERERAGVRVLLDCIYTAKISPSFRFVLAARLWVAISTA